MKMTSGLMKMIFKNFHTVQIVVVDVGECCCLLVSVVVCWWVLVLSVVIVVCW